MEREDNEKGILEKGSPRMFRGWYRSSPIKRGFLKRTGKIVLVFKEDAPEKLWGWSKEAYFYSRFGRSVQYNVCPNRCILSLGDRSFCRVKVNVDGKLYTLVYGNPCAVHVDPIEKNHSSISFRD